MGIADGNTAVEFTAGTGLLEDLLREPLSAQPAQRIKAARQWLRFGAWMSDLIAGVLGGGVLGTVSRLSSVQLLISLAGFAICWWGLGTVSGIGTDQDMRPWTTTLEKAKTTGVMALIIAWPALAALHLVGAPRPAMAALIAAGTAATVAVIGRSATHAIVHRSRDLTQRTVIIGSGVVAHHVVERLNLAPNRSLEIIGLVDDDVHHETSPLLPTLGTLDELADVIGRHDVDRVIIAFTRSGHNDLLQAIRTCWDNHVAIDIVPRLFEFLDGARTIDQVGGLPMLSITVPQLSMSARVLKRACDIVLSGLVLLLAAPMMSIVAVLIALDSPGSVLFRQERVGCNGKPFEIFKFRSMYVDAEARKREFAALNDLSDGILFKIHNDPRITRIGRFLRKSSLDELPQLVNVLRGEMSLVGPRPLIVEEIEGFDESWHRRRLDLRPGITGPWQIYGRSDIPFHDMLRFDYQYVAGWSLGRDFEILLSTIPVAFSGRGAY